MCYERLDLSSRTRFVKPVRYGFDTAKNAGPQFAWKSRARPFQINSDNQIVQILKSFKSFQSLRYPNFVVTMRSEALIQLQHFFQDFLVFSLDLFSCIIVSHITTIVNPTKCERLIFLLRFTFERLCSRHSWRWVGRRRAGELVCQTS